MIISEDIELKLSLPLTSEKIESALLKKGLKVLRWAIIECNDQTIKLTVSYEK